MPTPPLWRAYAAAVGAVLAALFVRFALDPMLGNHLPYVTFFVAVAAVAWYSPHLGPPVTAIMLGFVASHWYFVPPRQSFGPLTTPYLYGLGTYFMVTGAFVTFGSALQRARHRASQHQQQLQLISDTVPVLISYVDRDHRFQFCNRAYQQWFGLSQERMFGAPMREVLGDEVWAKVQPQVDAALAGQVMDFETILAYTHGPRWVHAIYTPDRDPSGVVRGLVIMVSDITARKQAEEELREREERYRMVTETATDVIVTIDEASRILFVNGAVERIFGYTPAELTGQPLTILMPEALRARHREGVAHYAQTQQKRLDWSRVQLPGRHKEGYEVPLEITFGEFLQHGQRLFTGTLRDITERKRAEAAIRTQNTRLQLLADAAGRLLSADDPDVMIRQLFERVAAHLGADAYFNFIVTDAGDALRLEVCGGIPEEEASKIARLEFGTAVCGTVALQRRAIHATDIQQSSDPKVQLVKGYGLRAYCCHPLMVGDRLIGTLSMATRRRDRFEDDEVEFLRTICHYVALAKERGTAMRQVQASLKEKEVMLKEIHHRVKNNLQIVSSLLSLQSNTIEDQAMLNQMQDSQNRIRSMALVHDQLYRTSDLSTISMQGYIRSLADQLFRSYGEPGRIKIHVQAENIAMELDTAIPCGLVLNELISNAFKHAFPNGRSGHIRVGLVRTAENLYRLTVEDDGVGLPRGFDLNKTDSLGLSLIQMLVEQLRGDLRVRSEQGTAVSIVFSGLTQQGSV